MENTYILHLSDLHLTGSTSEVERLFGQLKDDLKLTLNRHTLDAVVITGDIANRADPAEYTTAEYFVGRLCSMFDLEPWQLVVVPGNHDVNWTKAEATYNEDGSRDEEKHPHRFDHFRRFFSRVCQQPYPLEYEDQYFFRPIAKKKIIFLGFNSAWKLDNKITSDANINQDAFERALTHWSQKQYRDFLKIAVWHHPLHSEGEDRIRDQDFLKRLAINGFQIILHGHIHRSSDPDDFMDSVTTNQKRIEVIAAGTFGAPPAELRPAYPWQYSLLELSNNRLTVWPRKRTDLRGTWGPIPEDGRRSLNFSLDISYQPPQNNATGPLEQKPSPQIRNAAIENLAAAFLVPCHNDWGTNHADGVIIVLGADINLAGREKDLDGNHYWISSDNNRRYPPSSEELADYLDGLIHSVDGVGRGCLCFHGTSGGNSKALSHISMMLELDEPDGGHPVLINELQKIANADFCPNPIHKFFADLPSILKKKDSFRSFPLIVTTCFDRTLERAFEKNNQEIDRIVFLWHRNGGRFHYVSPSGQFYPLDESTAEGPPGESNTRWLSKRPLLIKLYAGIDQSREFVVTEDQYIDYLAHQGIEKLLPPDLLRILQTSKLWFLGYTPCYWNQRVILHRLWPGLESEIHESWAVQENPYPMESMFWRRYGVYPVNDSLEEFVRALQKRLS